MSISPEYGLLLDTAIPREPRRVDVRAWDGAQWGKVLRTADWHRLSPMLYGHVRSLDGVPGAVLSGLERSFLANSARTLYLRSALSQVLSALAAAGAPAMLLKGAALLETVYSDPAEREMLDLDLLVPADRLPAATAALQELGYAPEHRDESGGVTAEDGATSTHLELVGHHDDALIGDSRLVAVELHRHITIAGEGNRFAIEDFWRRGRPGSDPEHLLPAPADLLLHVCLHFTRNRLGGDDARHRHTGGALGQMADIHRIVDREPVDWDCLVVSARSYGLETKVFLALSAAALLGVRVPTAPMQALAPAAFNPEVVRRLVDLRVMRDGQHLPPRSLRWMFTPNREVLSRGWNAERTATVSLARAYLRRARAHAPLARSSLRRPMAFVHDRRLNGQIQAMEEQR